jgi:hypothetical protein
MKDASKIREIHFDFSEEEKQHLQEIINRSKPIENDEVVIREVGRPEIIEEAAFCPACREEKLVVFQQAIYHGPIGEMCIGGPHPKQYMRSEIRKQCGYCGIQVWKVAPHIQKLLGL